MNAYKLADELEGFGYLNPDDGLHFCPFQAQVDMLRQLQDDLSDLQWHIPAKKITDKELVDMYQELSDDFDKHPLMDDGVCYRIFPIEIGRAILKKAQE